MNYQVAVTDEEMHGCFWSLARRNGQVLTRMMQCLGSDYPCIQIASNCERFVLLTFFSADESGVKKFVTSAEMKELLPSLYIYGNGV